MHTQYIENFTKALSQTVFTDSKEEILADYNNAMENVVQTFLDVKRNKKQVFFIGNGGSAGIAVHMTADFIKNGGIKVQSLYSPSLLTCIGNDFTYGDIFSKPLELLMEDGDLLVAISSSGNSENIVNAIQTAKNKNSKVITLSGFKPNNKIRVIGDLNIYVPIEHYGIVESIHNLILQQVVDAIVQKDGIGMKK